MSLPQVGRRFHARGWVPATSGNLSVRIAPEVVRITASGAHKGGLRASDLLDLDLHGRPVVDTPLRPSAETPLHLALYRRDPAVGAVLHVHSPHAVVLSRLDPEGVVIRGHEVAKAFPGVTTHEGSVIVPVFPNDQDTTRLAGAVDAWLERSPGSWGYLIAGHGLHAWGHTLDDAVRHVEAFDFLFHCELLERPLRSKA